MKYWANVGYSARGGEYVEAFPRRKDPYHKINREVLESTLAEDLTDYIIKLQTEIQKEVKHKPKDAPYSEATKRANTIANSLVMVVLQGLGVIDKSVLTGDVNG
jgi:uncharacterized protein with ATP-grasp and redox domains